MTQNDVTELIKSILNVNSSVAERFLPVVKMAPFLTDVSEQAENSTLSDSTNSTAIYDGNI